MRYYTVEDIPESLAREIRLRPPGGGDYYSRYRCSDRVTFPHAHAPDVRICCACKAVAACARSKNPGK